MGKEDIRVVLHFGREREKARLNNKEIVKIY